MRHHPFDQFSVGIAARVWDSPQLSQQWNCTCHPLQWLSVDLEKSERSFPCCRGSNETPSSLWARSLNKVRSETTSKSLYSTTHCVPAVCGGRTFSMQIRTPSIRQEQSRTVPADTEPRQWSLRHVLSRCSLVLYIFLHRTTPPVLSIGDKATVDHDLP